MQLVLGEGAQVYDVDRGLQCSFKQSIVAVSLNTPNTDEEGARADGEDTGGQLSVIGDITQRIVIVPADYSAG